MPFVHTVMVSWQGGRCQWPPVDKCTVINLVVVVQHGCDGQLGYGWLIGTCCSTPMRGTKVDSRPSATGAE